MYDLPELTDIQIKICHKLGLDPDDFRSRLFIEEMSESLKDIKPGDRVGTLMFAPDKSNPFRWVVAGKLND